MDDDVTLVTFGCLGGGLIPLIKVVMIAGGLYALLSILGLRPF